MRGSEKPSKMRPGSPSPVAFWEGWKKGCGTGFHFPAQHVLVDEGAEVPRLAALPHQLLHGLPLPIRPP